MPAGDVWKVNLHHDLQGQVDNINTYYVVVDTDPPATTVGLDLVDWFKDEVATDIAADLNSEFEYKCVEAQRVLDANLVNPVNDIAEVEAVNIVGGEVTESSLPGQCSMLMQTLETRDQSSDVPRARDFYTGFNGDDQNDGIWAEATVIALQLILRNHLMGGFTTTLGGSYEWVFWSPKVLAQRIAAADVNILPYFTIGAIRTWRLVKTQRRRQPLDPCQRYYDIVEPAPPP